ncbi:conserved hypothetical protein [Ricinus communis]|uniref:Transmembrane protein n=1 Tax=Ricinus communis TaxID=3988 RepID=B9R9Z6_RICCO|nr:conserved hypothetical protein [Ricinus communis]|eukprot:XP_002511021.1 uncharacterized protein LOC8289668 [Ricinus communis]
MHRSASWTRTDDYFMHSSPKAPPGLRISSSNEANELPEDDPILGMAKKEKSHIKFSENAIHIIPFVLLLCGFILWFFSNPDVNVGNKPDSIASSIEGLTIEGDIDTDSDGTQTGFLPIDSGDMEAPKQIRNHHESTKKFANRF